MYHFDDSTLTLISPKVLNVKEVPNDTVKFGAERIKHQSIKQQVSTRTYSCSTSCYLQLLFISYKFVKGFLTITFLLLLISN